MLARNQLARSRLRPFCVACFFSLRSHRIRIPFNANWMHLRFAVFRGLRSVLVCSDTVVVGVVGDEEARLTPTQQAVAAGWTGGRQATTPQSGPCFSDIRRQQQVQVYGFRSPTASQRRALSG